jgi:GMP synthase-like glutamine amidotransferase
MRVHVLQHVAFEDIGSIADWLRERNAQITYTRFFESAELPSPIDFDLIIAMGGPMSANDDAELPWLIAEKQFIREAIKNEIPLLGICLGAQLVASALHACVYPNWHKEIGWFDIAPIDNSDRAFQFPEHLTVFHWHGETFDLPRDAIQIARSAGCENQAFQIGRNIIGLQFHLETTPETASLLVHHCGADIAEGKYIQNEFDILSKPEAIYLEMKAVLYQILNYLTQR